MILNASCLKFDYDCIRADQSLVLDSKFRFAVQAPKDPALPERAVIVHFSARGEADKFKLLCVCRVIFVFDSPDSIPDDQTFLHGHQAEAYAAMREMTNRILSAMNQREFPFPELACG